MSELNLKVTVYIHTHIYILPCVYVQLEDIIMGKILFNNIIKLPRIELKKKCANYIIFKKHQMHTRKMKHS